METYKLGPNGAILTCLNLFTTKFDQVLQLVDKKKDKLDYFLIDTPGQIEIFTWSASGSIITDAIDTPRSVNPTTFMSNMLYACSILYKTKLPFILCFNKVLILTPKNTSNPSKTDVVSHEFCLEWMQDFEAFQGALEQEQEHDGEAYMSTLVSSMCLVLEEFYSTLRVI
jgi:GTPase SAR1 family protein